MALPGPGGPPPPPTVLVAVRARVSRPPRLGPDPASAPADAPARLQLSVEPGPGGQQRFRLVLRHTDPRPSGSLVEYDLKDISYVVRSPTCHELAATGCAEEPMVLTFEEEREAQKWWTVVSSSLREVQKAAESTGILAAQPPLLSSVIGSPAAAPEEEVSLELSKTEDLALRLSLAIEVGNEQAASQCAVVLARQQASLQIQPKESSHPTNEISMKVCVEDATCSANITLRVHTHMTVATLKQQVFQDYKFHPSVQRWIIGQCLCVDERTVSSYGIRKDGDTAFLYLLSVKQAGLSEQRFREDLTQAQAALRPAASLTDSAGVDDKRKCSTLPAAAPRKVWGSDSGRKMNIDEISRHLDLLQVSNLLYNHPLGALATAAPPSPVQTGWSCPKCTFINKPTRPGCEMCSADRPPGYVVPGGYAPDEMELWRMQQEKDGIRQYQQALEDQRLQNFQRLKQLDEAALVPNQETLECLICFQTVAPGAGVLLRECLHNFCRDCLRQVISYSEEPQVACPFRDDTYACSSHLQEREIRALVSPEEYQRFLGRGLAVAEQRVPNSYHCRTADCPGWCVYEDAVNEFRCPLCAKLNCLLCKAIHEGQNCRQYQDNLQLQAHDDVAARQTNDMLQMLVQCGEAMHCPACHIVVQKKDGCDWIRCTVCHTEICWVTKGPRWGPGGPGDTSGGCRCNVNGQRCHPRCQNCH